MFSTLFSSQSSAFTALGLSYEIIAAAPDNQVELIGCDTDPCSDLDIKIPATVNDGIIDYAVTSVKDKAFEDQNISSVDIGKNIQTFGEKAFKGNALMSVAIPDSVKIIGRKAFESNVLETLTVPASVNTIEPNAFNRNSLSTVQFSSVQFRGSFGAFDINTMFDNNTQLATVNYCSSAMNWSGQTFFNGSVSLTSTPINCTGPTSVPLAPPWLLALMTGLLTLLGLGGLRKNGAE
jgi:hypothetical protein